nr:hypothetical protein Iba_chr03aCG16220 [Ipomoea batatas]
MQSGQCFKPDSFHPNTLGMRYPISSLSKQFSSSLSLLVLKLKLKCSKPNLFRISCAALSQMLFFVLKTVRTEPALSQASASFIQASRSISKPSLCKALIPLSIIFATVAVFPLASSNLAAVIQIAALVIILILFIFFTASLPPATTDPGGCSTTNGRSIREIWGSSSRPNIRPGGETSGTTAKPGDIIGRRFGIKKIEPGFGRHRRLHPAKQRDM